MKRMNKKAMVFTLLVIALLSLFLVSYLVYSAHQEQRTIHQRVKTLNNFVFSIEQDLSRQVYIAGFRVILIFEKRIAETGTYISTINETVAEVFYNGTLYGEQQELMQGIIFSDIINLLDDKGRDINAHVQILHPTIIIRQEDPWHVTFVLDGELVVQDLNGLVSWNKSFSMPAYVSVENFEDPLYTINTNSKVIHTINRTAFIPFVQGSDVSNLNSHVAGVYYINSSLAPSFLDRLQGKSNANSQGIESLVNVQELANQGIAVKTKSVVDYIYFSESNPSSHTVQGMPSWFRIDDAHLDIYGVSGLAN
ncbi:MAG: hypothetical protein RL557_1085 [archaeon]|jgi:hypothetical protein